MANPIPSPGRSSGLNNNQNPYSQTPSQLQTATNFMPTHVKPQNTFSYPLVPRFGAPENSTGYNPNQSSMSQQMMNSPPSGPINNQEIREEISPSNNLLNSTFNNSQFLTESDLSNVQNGSDFSTPCPGNSSSSQYLNNSVNGVTQGHYEIRKATISSQFPSQVQTSPANNSLINQSPVSLPVFSNTVGRDLTAQRSLLQLTDTKPVPAINSVPSAGLPLPYNSQSAASFSPQITPGPSQPPSARSSRNPSPISTQRYDYMEGQFSNKPSPSNSTINLRSTNNSNSSHMIPVPYSSHISAANFNSFNYPPNSNSTPNFPPAMSVPYSNFSPGTPQTTLPPVNLTPGNPRYPHPQQIGYTQQTPSPIVMPPRSVVPPSPMYNSPQLQSSYPGPVGLPEGPVGGASGYDPQLHARLAGMSVDASFSKLWGTDSVNLLQDKNVLPATPIDPPRVSLSKQNCDPNIFRCTLNKIPESNSVLQKSRLPFGIIIHPFRDVSNLAVIQCNTIVRCRNCRTYINPFAIILDQRRWKCNLCYRANDLPEEFLYHPVTKQYGDPTCRPEMKNATIEFIAPSDYMLRPPQPASYLFVLDVSHTACEIGYLANFCNLLLENLENLPGDSRTRIGFITFDGSIHFYNLAEDLKQPHMIVVSDIEDVFLPSPDNLLVNLSESKELIKNLLEYLPKKFASNWDTSSCLGVALEAAYKLMSPIGGRVTVFQTTLANKGPGSLKNREDPNQRAAKDVANVGPASDFYKKLALECSGQQVAVDLFLLCSQYVDIATISCISKYSSGCVHYYPGYHHELCKVQVNKFSADFKRYLKRRIGFEAVMRIRCTRGLAIHTFHGNFFVRSTDLLSLPNVNPDIGFGMQIAIEESVADCISVCFQAAVLYTSSNGERRIRVHTLCIPVVSDLQVIWANADQEAIIALVSKMAVDRSITSSLRDANDALINVCIDLLGAYKMSSQSGDGGALIIPNSTRLIPLFVLALLKHVAFRTGVSTKLDERVYSMELMKTLPLQYLMKYIYPRLYPVHVLNDKNAIHQDDNTIIPQPPILQLSSEKIDRHGVYLLDTYGSLILYIGRAVNDVYCTNVFGVPNFMAISDSMTSLPELPNPFSESLRNFISWLQLQRPSPCSFMVLREDSAARQRFFDYMIDDRTESMFSYYEFLQHLRQQISK